MLRARATPRATRSRSPGGGTQHDFGYRPASASTRSCTTRGSTASSTTRPAIRPSRVEAGDDARRAGGGAAPNTASGWRSTPPHRSTRRSAASIATNAFGPRRTRYGIAQGPDSSGRRFVRADGALARGGGKVVKNVAGFDLPAAVGRFARHARAASPRATFRLHPLPEARAVVRLHCATARVSAGGVRDAAKSAGSSPPPCVALNVHARAYEALVAFEGFARGRRRAGARVADGAASARRGRRTRSSRRRVRGGARARAHRRAIAREGGAPRRSARARPRAAIAPHAARSDDARSRSIPRSASLSSRTQGERSATSCAALPNARATLERAGGALVLLAALPPRCATEVDVWGAPRRRSRLMRELKARFDPDRRLDRGRFVGGLVSDAATRYVRRPGSSGLRALRLLPAGVPDVRVVGRRDGLAARPHRPDEGRRRRDARARRDGGRALRRVPGLHGVRPCVPVGRSLRPADRTRRGRGSSAYRAHAGRPRVPRADLRALPVSAAAARAVVRALRLRAQRPATAGARQRRPRAAAARVCGSSTRCCRRSPRATLERAAPGARRGHGKRAAASRWWRAACSACSSPTSTRRRCACCRPKASRRPCRRARAVAVRSRCTPAATTRPRRSRASSSPRSSANAADAIVVNAAGCGSTLKEYGALLAGDAQWRDRAARVRGAGARRQRVSRRRSSRSRRARRCELRVAYHDACHLAHAQGIREQPRALLRSIPGSKLVEIPAGDQCCGSAGTTTSFEPRVARRRSASARSTTCSSVRARHSRERQPRLHAADRVAAARARDGVEAAHPIELLDRSIAGRDSRALRVENRAWRFRR